MTRSTRSRGVLLSRRRPARGHAGSPGTSTPSGCRLPVPGPGSRFRIAGRADPHAGTRLWRAPGRPRSRASQSAPTPAPASSSSSLAAPTGSLGETRASQRASDIHMFPTPATRRWSCKHLAEGTRRVGPAKSRDDRRRVGPGSQQIRANPSQRRWSRVRTGPFHCVASIAPPCSTSHGRPVRFEPTGPTCQRPLIRRWLRIVTPPSNREQKMLPERLDADQAGARRPPPRRRSHAHADAASSR